ncbi:hypothetical protein NDU88_007821 [Pleurodeles waltl]|uniref:Uncharacterized protein n=1 Tax=Pleurodeles waltl TaxID=8319 RepID=A0AAV7VTN8_PLEWA|nr:hypothetical protein NDU88_007821 [Pleurodeles waltl]
MSLAAKRRGALQIRAPRATCLSEVRRYRRRRARSSSPFPLHSSALAASLCCAHLPDDSTATQRGTGSQMSLAAKRRGALQIRAPRATCLSEVRRYRRRRARSSSPFPLHSCMSSGDDAGFQIAHSSAHSSPL